jgi:acyl-CoA reductase-like NAD-dependent aldehyde dehydrogenase
MGLASYFFTKNVDRTWRLLENLEAGMVGMNSGKSLTLALIPSLHNSHFRPLHDSLPFPLQLNTTLTPSVK